MQQFASHSQAIQSQSFNTYTTTTHTFAFFVYRRILLFVDLDIMAATAAMASASIVAAPAAATKLSSSAAFGPSQAQFAPLRNVNVNGGRVVAVTANYSEVSYHSVGSRLIAESILF